MLPSSSRRRVGAPSDSDSDSDPNSTGLPSQSQIQNRTDLISQLPDCVLSSIISLLPIRDSIRTSVLSSRFRHLWKLNPLHLDCSAISDTSRYKTREIAARIASAHPGPILSDRVSSFNPDRELDDLTETLFGKGIRDLTLHFGYDGKQRYRLPFSLLQCQTLRKVSLSDCFFPPSPVLDSSFPNIKELTLEFVFIWDDLLHCLLKSCVQLEELQLINCSGLQYVRVNCAKLQKLTINEDDRKPFERFCNFYVKEVAIENTPELKSLRLGEGTLHGTRISVQHVQKLEVLGFFCMNAKLRIGNTFSNTYDQPVMYVNESMKLSMVKKLAIIVDVDDDSQYSLLPSVLRCFPCLETLDIKCFGGLFGPDEGFWEQQAPFSFFEHHLRYVTMMINSSKLIAEMQFLKFLIRHGWVLERITFVCERKLTDTWQKTMRHELGLLDCASINPEVVFLGESGSCEWAPLFFHPEF